MALPLQSPLSVLTVSSYNGTATVNNGIAAQVATVALTGQTATLTNHALFTAAYTGFYRLSGWMKKTLLASGGTPSSTLGPMMVATTDGGDGHTFNMEMSFISSTGAVTTSNGGNGNLNQLSASSLMNYTFYVQSGAAVTFTLTYASAGTTPMQYELFLVVEAL